MINVLIVDDSALVRQVLADVINRASDINVVATAGDPYAAAEKLKRVKPDVIMLDVEMPKMDGLTFLRKLMSQHPIPVVICSTLAGKGTATHMQALESGAVDIIQKPTLGLKGFADQQSERLHNVIRAASQAKLKPLLKQTRTPVKHSADAVIKRVPQSAMHETTEKIIVIGASTGGTEAVKTVLSQMPINSPGILVVQHMPEGFTKSFAARLDSVCQINVAEAKGGETLLRGHAFITPGNLHSMVRRSGAKYFIELKDGPPVSRHKPSVDVLMRSAAQTAGRNAVGCILTGMGSDGAAGMLELHQAGAFTIGQDEKTSVVYGMPREAFERGGITKQLPLDQIAAALLKAAR